MDLKQINPFEINCDRMTASRSGELSKHLEMGTIVLGDSLARLHAPISKLVGAEMALEMGFESGFQYVEDLQQFVCVVKVHAKGSIGSDNNKFLKKGDEIFTVVAHYVLETVLHKRFENDDDRNLHFSAFSSINAPMMIWAMWREFLQSSTGRMGLTPITAPFLRVEVKEETPDPK